MLGLCWSALWFLLWEQPSRHHALLMRTRRLINSRTRPPAVSLLERPSTTLTILSLPMPIRKPKLVRELSQACRWTCKPAPERRNQNKRICSKKCALGAPFFPLVDGGEVVMKNSLRRYAAVPLMAVLLVSTGCTPANNENVAKPGLVGAMAGAVLGCGAGISFFIV